MFFSYHMVERFRLVSCFTNEALDMDIIICWVHFGSLSFKIISSPWEHSCPFSAPITVRSDWPPKAASGVLAPKLSTP